MDVIISIIGWLGAGLIVAAFFLNAQNRLSAKSQAYLWMNLVGALCIVVNSFHLEAYPQMALNIVWFFIAVHGLIRREK